jgi:YHS domain-containing protein
MNPPGREPGSYDRFCHKVYYYDRKNPGNKKGGYAMATDPVCYMVVDEDEARCRASYRGTIYYFCSDFCRKKLEENPERYAKLARSLDLGPDISC